MGQSDFVGTTTAVYSSEGRRSMMMVDVSGSWTEDERSKFVDALTKYGSDWNRISRAIDSKSVQEVYEYATTYYKTLMSGKDLRSIETMKSTVCMALLSEKVRLEQGATGSANAKENSLAGNVNSPRAVAKDAEPLLAMHLKPMQAASMSPTNQTYSMPVQVYKTGLSGNPYENRIKDLSDADIKLLLRNRILDMTRRKQENLAKRKLHESFASQQIMAFQAKHGVGLPATATTPEATSSKAKRTRANVLAPRNATASKKRKGAAGDGFAGVDALAKISAEELQKYKLPLQTPAASKAPWDFASITPADKEGKRARWTAAEHELFVEGVKRFGRKWKKVQEHVKTKTKEQVRSHANAYFAKPSQDAGDVLEVAGFLSSLAQGPSPRRA
ncbi:hypothetical protein ACHHYP_01419 [Achlya hypogyna]|uniref:Myb-like DNA-binding protein n=1 Tax=Achlya hypogyna TaxID=1202772 RepID=A0A1V9Z8R6_ACHHY|nr:hypothetical protein ACHHYP_01419 [Achlya hypogyna]